MEYLWISVGSTLASLIPAPKPKAMVFSAMLAEQHIQKLLRCLCCTSTAWPCKKDVLYVLYVMRLVPCSAEMLFSMESVSAPS